ncbi:unnamed protein product [Meloidogyne enterolobii]|uniref:Uncharacterized protein n=1 Tax=Meloidogyne enterolobii TaxID=390850 RepID=A0ACB0ZDE2_MELEN
MPETLKMLNLSFNIRKFYWLKNLSFPRFLKIILILNFSFYLFPKSLKLGLPFSVRADVRCIFSSLVFFDSIRFRAFRAEKPWLARSVVFRFERACNPNSKLTFPLNPFNLNILDFFLMSLIFESPPLLDERQSTKLFNYLFILSQCFGILAVFGVAIWMGAFEDGGFSWSENPSKQFHYHPTFMVIAVIFLQGESINERKRFVKLLHLSTHSVALLLVLIALKAVWDSHGYF